MLDIDLDVPGRSQGYLSFHNSTNESAWQSVRVPIYCLKGEAGPTTLLIGGVHGDEYEGPVAISALCHDLDIGELKGRLIAIPAMNLPAVIAGTRLSPADGANLNRVFPGDARGSLTSRMARALTDHLVVLADHVIDLHSGGQSLLFAPCTLLHAVETPEVMAKTLRAAQAFGAPFTAILDEDFADTMLDAVVEGAGKIMISSELGGSGALTRGSASLAKAGLRRSLAALGHFADRTSAPPTRTVVVPRSGMQLVAEDSAIFEPFVDLGQMISKDAPVGVMHRIDRIVHRAEPILAPASGIVLCLPGQGMVHRGSVVCVLAQERPA